MVAEKAQSDYETAKAKKEADDLAKKQAEEEEALVKLEIENLKKQKKEQEEAAKAIAEAAVLANKENEQQDLDKIQIEKDAQLKL